MKEAIEIVQRHSDAYNAKDLEIFMSCFGDNVRFFKPPSLEPVLSGKAQVAQFYRTQRFHLPNLKSELLNRMVVGNKVIDHERTFGIQDHPIEAVLVNEVVNGLIETVWIYT